MGGLIKHNLLPEMKEEYIMARRVYEFNRYLKAICKFNTTYYRLDERAINFLDEIGCTDLISQENNVFYLEAKLWDKKIYQPYMDIFRTWIAQDKDTILNKLNESIFLEDWNKYAKGTISSWEMEVLCFYYHEHELENVNQDLYGFVDFYSLSEDPEVDRTFVKNDKEIKIFKLHKICGTCIAKNKTKATVTLLTTTGVVNVKFRKEYFSLFDKQISEYGADGLKHVVQKSWFNRGNMIVVNGMRSGDDFIVKKYASTNGHQLYHIDKINSDGTLLLSDSRPSGDISEDNSN
jgi:DNA polymerase-3 subunit alpha